MKPILAFVLAALVVVAPVWTTLYPGYKSGTHWVIIYSDYPSGQLLEEYPPGIMWGGPPPNTFTVAPKGDNQQ